MDWPNPVDFSGLSSHTTVSGEQNRIIIPGTSDTDLWDEWQAELKGHTKKKKLAYQHKVLFWIAVSLPAKKFSENIRRHKEIPMLIPASGKGTLLGVANDKQELDSLVEKDSENVHLVYKVAVRGPEVLHNLLEFLARNDMLEKEDL